MSAAEKTAWALLLLVLWFMVYASIVRLADPDPVQPALNGEKGRG